jgi:hypothetical protein
MASEDTINGQMNIWHGFEFRSRCICKPQIPAVCPYTYVSPRGRGPTAVQRFWCEARGRGFMVQRANTASPPAAPPVPASVTALLRSRPHYRSHCPPSHRSPPPSMPGVYIERRNHRKRTGNRLNVVIVEEVAVDHISLASWLHKVQLH